jgi:hypothetical protein
MTRLTLSFCTLAALGMAGCTTYYDPPPPVAVTTTTGAPVVSAGSSAPATRAGSNVTAPTASASAWKPGAGVIQTISLGAPPADASASAGGSAPSAVTGMGPYRVTLRMDDGTVQNLVVDNRAFLVGDRVQVTPEGSMVRQQ